MRCQFLSVLALFFGLVSTASAAPEINPQLLGEFKIVERARDGSSRCPDVIRIRASEHGVSVTSGDDAYLDSFFFANEGCKSLPPGEDVNLTPRPQCTTFNETEIYSTDTALTIVGYVREYSGIRLDDFGRIVYEHDNTVVPFGVLNLWDDEKFFCAYKKAE